MHWKDRYTFIVFVLFGLKYISYVQGASSLSQSSYTVKGFPGSLQCTVTPLSSSVEFQKNSVFKGQCFVPGDPASCTTSVSQSGETTYFNITSLSYTEHDGVWTCVNYLGDKHTNLTVYSPFGDTSITSTKTKLLSGESTQLTCRMKCQYPINSGFSSIEIWKNDGKIKSLTSYTATTPSASDGCEAHEQNLDAVFTIFSTDACGNDKLYCKFHHDVLGTNTSNSLSLEFPNYNWHILVGWIVGVLIIPVAGLVCFIFNEFIIKKPCPECGENQKFKLAVGITLGAGVLVSLIVCIIIATQVCFSTFSSAFGVGIGVSFGIMFICVIIIVVILFTCMKVTVNEDEIGNKKESGSEETGDRRKPTTETSKDTRKSDDKPLKTVGVAKPIVQDRPGSQITSENDVQIRPKSHTSKVSHNSTYENEKSKALEDVPKTRPLPSPRKDDNEEKIIITKPSKLPPIDHENSTSSPKKKKKKKKKSKENESENEEKVDSP